MRRAVLVLVAAASLGERTSSAEKTVADLRPKSPDAQRYLAEGKKSYDIGDFNGAIEKYKAGALVESAPMFNFNLGQVYRQIGDYRAAIFQYQRFLSANPPQEMVVSVQKLLDQMRAELDRQAMREKPTEAITGLEKPTTVVASSAAPSSVVEPWYADAFGWGLSGAGAVAIGAAGYLFVSASSLTDDASNTPDQTRRHDLENQAHTRNVVGAVVVVGGIGLLAAGVIKLVVHSAPAHSRTAVKSLTIQPADRGISVAGRF